MKKQHLLCCFHLVQNHYRKNEPAYMKYFDYRICSKSSYTRHQEKPKTITTLICCRDIRHNTPIIVACCLDDCCSRKGSNSDKQMLKSEEKKAAYMFHDLENYGSTWTTEMDYTIHCRITFRKPVTHVYIHRKQTNLL